MYTIRNNSQRSLLTLIFLSVSAVVSLLSIYSGSTQLEVIQNIKSGVSYSGAELESTDLRQQIIAIISLIVFIATATVFIMWFRRAYFNLEQKTEYLNHTNSGAVWGWFVPFVNFVKPVRMMHELYSESHDLFRKHVPDYKSSGNRTWISIWWAFWLIGSIIANYSFRISLSAKSIDSLITVLNTGIAAEILQVISALLAIKVVYDYSRNEPLMSLVENSGTAVVQPDSFHRNSDLLDA